MLDDFDTAILHALHQNASLTNAQLSQQVGLSPSQCSRRRSALESRGIIRGYRADLDARALGYNVEAVVRVTLSSHSETTDDEFAHFLANLPQVQHAHSLTGDSDYVLFVRMRSLDDLATFIHKRLLPHSQVSQVRSDVVLKTIKRDQGFRFS